MLPCVKFIEHFLAHRMTVDNVCLVLHTSEQYVLEDLRRGESALPSTYLAPINTRLVCEEFVSYRYSAVKKSSAFKNSPNLRRTDSRYAQTDLCSEVY